MLGTGSKVGIIAGSGDLPLNIIQHLISNNIDFCIAGIKGNVKRKHYSTFDVFYMGMGEVEKLFNQFQKKQVTHVVLAGSIIRPSIFSLKLDKTARTLARDFFYGVSGDDNLLRVVIKLIEQRGFKVLGAHQILTSLLVSKGIFANKDAFNSIDNTHINYGISLAKQIGKLDIGQSIIMQGNYVVSVEASEGTDKMIKRSKKLLKKSEPAILYKVSKPQQDERVDMPTIGSKTIVSCFKNGIKGIVLESDSVIFLNRQRAIDLANKYNIFIVAV